MYICISIFIHVILVIPLKTIQVKNEFGKVAGYKISIKIQFYFCI